MGQFAVGFPDSAIHDGDCARLGKIDENLTACRVELKTFGMDRQWNVSDPLGILGVDHSQTAAAISNQNAIAGAVHADIVGVLAKIDLSGRGIIRPREDAHRSIARVGAVRTLRTITESQFVVMRRSDSGVGDSGALRMGVGRSHDRRGGHLATMGSGRLEAR